MDLLEIDFYKKIKGQAMNKGYDILIKELEVGIPGERALASHYVDYQNKKIEIGLPKVHEEMVELFIHELIHAELFLEGYPRILRSPEVEYTELDEIIAEEIENTAQHYLLYPRMDELGYKHLKSNDDFFQKVVSKTKQLSKGPNEILDGFTILEADYRDYNKFKSLDSDIASKNPNTYGFYRRLKRVYSRINNQSSMRKAIIKIMNEIEEKTRKSNGINLNYRIKFNIPPVPTKYEKERICSNFYKVVNYSGHKNHYIFDKRDNRNVKIINGNSNTNKELENMLNELTVNEFFK